jgi:hypothetical protein
MDRHLRRVLIIMLFLYTGQLFCQESLSGIILSSEDKLPIQNAQITIHNEDFSIILAYTFSQKDGTFVLKVPTTNIPFGVEFSSMGYAKIKKMFVSIPVGRQTIILTPSEIQIKELIIKAPKVSRAGDTLNYMTSEFKKQQDRSVGDVLKRIPGFDVSKTGAVTFNENPINALYIEGKNLLEAQYGLAIQNIDPDIVSMIQVFENHQPIKVLEKATPSENAAINLILDRKVKSKFILSGDLRCGLTPLLWDSRAMLFQFDRKFQTMNLVKSNNVGKDIKWEIGEQNLGAATESQLIDKSDVNMVNITGPSDLPLGEERTTFNQSHMISTNTLFSLGEDLQAIVKLNYIYDHRESWQNQRVEYILANEGNIVIDENNSYRGIMNSPEIDFVLKSNSSKYFLQNRINGKFRYSSNYALTGGTVEIEQIAKLRQYDLSELFSFIKPIKKSIFRVNSKTQIRSLPQKLSVVSEEIDQSVSYFQLQSNNKATIQRVFGRVNTEIKGGVDFTYQQMETNLTGFEERNSLKHSFTDIFIAPSFRFEQNGLRFSAESPIRLQNSRLRITPNLALRYKFSPFWEGSLNYSFNTTQTDITEMNSASVLVDYRSIIRGYERMLENRYNVLAVRGIFNNPLKMINFFASASFNKIINGFTNSIQFEDYYNIRTLLPQEQGSSSVSLQVNVTKSFFDLPLLLDLKTNCLLYKGSIVQQGLQTGYKTQLWTLIPRIEATLWGLFNIDFNSRISVSKRVADIGSGTYILTDYNPKLLLGYKFSENFNAQVKFDCYINDQRGNKHAGYLFTDIRASYNIGKGTLSFDWTNIFNNKSYKYSWFSELSTLDREFKLRPWNLMIGYSFTL